MKRGEIWWAELPPPMGSRPVVLLSRDEAYHSRQLVTVGVVTTTVWKIPAEVPLGPEDGLAKPCVANLDTILTVRKSQLTRCISLLRPEKIERINAAVKFALALP